MKILVVHNAYQSHHVGGEDVVVKKEVKALKAALGDNAVFEYYVSNDEIKTLDLVSKLWGNQHHFKKIADLVKLHQIDVVHVHNFFPLLTPTVFAGAKYAGAKVVHTLHNFRWWCSSGIFYRNQGECEKCIGKTFGWPGVVHKCYRNSFIQSMAANMAFAWYRIKEYAKHIDAYFVLTKFQQQKLQTQLQNAKVFLKPNGIEQPLNNGVVDKKDYLFVGRLETAKGIDLLLATWKQLPPSFNLKVIGTGENEAALRAHYACDNIRFVGKLEHEQVMQEMRKAKFFVHSSLTYETFGLTLLEALSVGTPVIAIDRGPRSEFIQNGYNGYLSTENNFLQTLLQTALVNDYETMSANAFESARPFYMNKVIDTQIDYYQQLLTGNQHAFT